MQALADIHIHQDLKMAAEFQRSVLPAEPDLSYLSTSILYRPAGHISGDVYNFQLNREHELSVFLGDATGHGITAALMTMLVHLGLDNFPGNLGTDEILRRLNTVIARHNTCLSIASQLFRISPDGTLRVTHAGQPSLIVLSSAHDKQMVFNQGGCPIGMFDEEMVPYREESTKLTQGDRLITYTDGLIDWKNHQGQNFGFDRLIDVLALTGNLPISELPQAILDAVTGFAGHDANHDDVTLLCFEYLGDQEHESSVETSKHDRNTM